MANIKIAQLTNQISLSDTDLVIIESATSTNKMSVGNLKKSLKIVESGSNADGDWIKYSDGTMICTGIEATINLIFPLEFIAPPKVFLAPIIGVASVVIANPMNITKSGCNLYRAYWDGTTFANAGESVNFMAIGRYEP